MGNSKLRLSVPQINALKDAASVNVAELTQFRSVTRNKLVDLGLIDKLENEGLYVLSRNGLEWLICNAADTFISSAHLFNVGDVVRNRYMGPVGIIVAVHENGLYVEFRSHTEGINYGAVSAYVAATDSEIDAFQRADWNPTFIQGTDDNDPELKVLGSDVIDGKSVVWVETPNGEFYLEADKPLTQRYWRAFPVQPMPTKWVGRRRSLNAWRDEDVALTSMLTDIASTREGALQFLLEYLNKEIAGWDKMGMDSTRDEYLRVDVIMGKGNRWRRDGVELSVHGW